ncbi:MAG: autotransporter outer membrane beta-barrel domain-containing protein, partial [Planctomycetaceae bacterium]|nr:autotransporter outer membrane beta-barrel domain-containing protein [Planctomycetaceae bacterium]
MFFTVLKILVEFFISVVIYFRAFVFGVLCCIVCLVGLFGWVAGLCFGEESSVFFGQDNFCVEDFCDSADHNFFAKETFLLTEAIRDELLIDDGISWSDDVKFGAQGLPSDVILAQAWRGRGGCLWGNLYYSDTVLKPKDSSWKTKPDSYGLQVGIDVLTDHEVYSTFVFNVNQSKTKIGNHAKSTIDNFLFGYGKLYHWQIAHAAAGMNIGYDQYSINSLGHKFTGNGLQARLDGEVGLSFIFTKWDIKPFYGLQYDFVYHGRLDAKDSSGVFQGDYNGHNLSQLLGIRFNWKPIAGLLLFQSRFTWVHELLKNPQPFYSSHFSS